MARRAKRTAFKLASTSLHDKDSLTEEPCAVNVASTVLKRRRGKRFLRRPHANWRFRRLFAGRRFTPAATRAFEFSDASFEFSDAFRLQKKDLALQIGEARGLRGLNILDIFQGDDASQKFFDSLKGRWMQGL